MSAASETGAQPAAIEPNRHPAALAAAITRAWQPYRWRAYAAGVVAGLVVGGIAAPIATTTLLMAMYLAGVTATGALWQEGLWSLSFGLAFPAAAATAFARWQPVDLRKAAETYLWVAMRAEANWRRATGLAAVPRDPAAMRAFLASAPETPATAAERFGIWIALLDVPHARAALAEIPTETARGRFARASAGWLADFTEGTTPPLEPLEALAAAIDDPDERQEAATEVALNRARAALAEGMDWRAPLAAARAALGAAPDTIYRHWVWRPVFRTALISAATGLVVYWIAINVLAPYFPFS